VVVDYDFTFLTLFSVQKLFMLKLQHYKVTTISEYKFSLFLSDYTAKKDNCPTMFLFQRLYSVSKPTKGTQSVPRGISTRLFVLFIQQGKWH